uniref:Chondroitin sulfate proteoglycan 4 n=1 Tax=Cacopsylla melanoneura TaxID=428564 RepID=A0A8D8UW31_9HEMI
MNDILVSVQRPQQKNYASNFTQADINAARVLYVHNSNNTGQISFYFRVHDGKFNPVYNLFNINIVPIRLSIDVRRPVSILQTHSLASISPGIFNIQSNLNTYKHLVFTVVRPPHNGVLYVNEKKTNSFSYPDLEAGRVVYMQTNMASFSDMVELSGTVLKLANLDRLFVNFTVEPLINLTKFEAVSGSRVKLSSSVLNVDELATLSHVNPVFRIVKKPRLGKIKKIIRSSGGGGAGNTGGAGSASENNLRESEISVFTYDQVRHGVIYYVSRKLNVSSTDCFVYLLNASSSIYQPAIGEFCFPVHLHAVPGSPLNSPKSRINNQQNQPGGYGAGGGGVELSAPNISNDYATIVGMIASVILVSIIIVFIVRARSKRLVDRKKLQYSATETPLTAQPMKTTGSLVSDDLVMTSPRPRTQSAAVLPLHHMDNIKYPYGAVEQEEEDGGGVLPLRRNQYWV